MTKKINLLLTAAPVVFLALLTAALAVMRAGLPEVTVRIAGYDPRDLLSGHYIAYTIDWENTDCGQFENGICPKEAFYESGIDGLWGNNHRFYIPERKAAELDRIFRNGENDDRVFEVVYGFAPGFRPLAKRMLINGQDWRKAVD